MKHTPTHPEPIAIVGMACRFPGEAENTEAYWEVLRSGGITVGEVPATRWDWRRHYSANADAPGRAYVKHGNFIRQDLRALNPSTTRPSSLRRACSASRRRAPGGVATVGSISASIRSRPNASRTCSRFHSR